MPHFTDIPLELFLDNILPRLPIPDLLSLSGTNRDFYKLASDDTFWHRKIQADFNFSGSDTARTTGWKFIYKRLRNPKIYVWGETTHNRLGVRKIPQSSVPGGVPYPIRLKIPGVQIVSLVAGGMSFHALDAKGSIYVWGVLDGTQYALGQDGFSEPAKRADVPMRLKLPAVFRSITCGRLHTTALDSNATIWTFTSWGRPFQFISPLLDISSPETTPIQVECGWCFTAILTKSSDVLVYWPLSGRIEEIVREKNQEFDKVGPSTKAIVDKSSSQHGDGGDIPCHAWRLEGVNPVQLPPIPAQKLPQLPNAGLSDKEISEETKLIRIAGMDNNLIGLTNKGHVLRYGRLEGEETFEQGKWEYLPNFSELAKLKEDALFSDANEHHLEPPQELRITHVTAQYKTFIAYSTGPQSVVLVGNFETSTEFNPPLPPQPPTPRLPTSPLQPKLIPKLQYQSVISVVLGDYHFGALTSTGKLFTWGSFAKGALGLGDPTHDIEVGQPGGFAGQRQLNLAREGRFSHHGVPDVREPTEVRFDWDKKRKGGKREMYAFGATAAGWHLGALVIDLEPDGHDDEEEEEALPIPGSFPPDGPAQAPHFPGPYGGIPIIPMRGRGVPHFRIGFAGRGGFVGGRGQGPALP